MITDRIKSSAVVNDQTRTPDTGAGTPPRLPAGTIALPPKSTMLSLVRDLVRPYRGWLVVVFAAMLVETVMSLAAPWPLKLVLDDALGHHHLPDWLAWAHDYGIDRNTLGVALFAGVATIVIASLSAVATYIDNYYTESIGQWVANDLRIRIYEHLHRLSLAYYDPAQTGTLLSTITNDVSTVQSFASASTLGILVDLMTIVGMLGLMFWLNWDFALIAVGVTPFLLFFVMRFKKAVKDATRNVRKRQSDIVAVVQQGLGSVRAVQAFGRQDLETHRMQDASHATEISFDHVAFAYGAEAPVLRDVSFTIEAGQVVGIVGPTGGGKSTVVSLIPRFYDPTGGRVLIDGTDIRSYTIAGLRR